MSDSRTYEKRSVCSTIKYSAGDSFNVLFYLHIKVYQEHHEGSSLIVADRIEESRIEEDTASLCNCRQLLEFIKTGCRASDG